MLTALLAACGGGSDQGRDPILGLPAADLVSVTVTPATSSILAGASQQLKAIASYSDGTSRDVTTASAWTTATPAVATIAGATGLAKGVSAGSTAVSAAYSSRTGVATLVVTVPVPVIPPTPLLSSIAVTPATASINVGATQQYVAVGTYSDNSTAVITNAVTWTSSSGAVAGILPSGMANGLTAGASTITATSGVKSATAALTVVALPVIPPVVVPPVVVPPVVVPPVVVPPVVVPPVVVPPIVQPPVVEPPVVLPPFNVTLRRAANFAVLAGTSITNNAGGTTVVTGDVGSPSQTVDPTQTAGYGNYKSGSILAGALEDLTIAVDDANNQPCTVSSAAGIDLGGLVLTPGVYCYSGAVNITGTFSLSGPGQYIFRIATTLNSTANSTVALLAGADASGIFWVPTGATTLGANSVFKGSILSKTAAITLGDNVSLVNGRVLSGAAVTLRNNKISK